MSGGQEYSGDVEFGATVGLVLSCRKFYSSCFCTVSANVNPVRKARGISCCEEGSFGLMDIPKGGA